MSLLKIAQLMGNSPEICRRHYAALVPEQMHDEINFYPAGNTGEEPHTPAKCGADPFAAENTHDYSQQADRPLLRLVR